MDCYILYSLIYPPLNRTEPRRTCEGYTPLGCAVDLRALGQWRSPCARYMTICVYVLVYGSIECILNRLLANVPNRKEVVLVVVSIIGVRSRFTKKKITTQTSRARCQSIRVGGFIAICPNRGAC